MSCLDRKRRSAPRIGRSPCTIPSSRRFSCVLSCSVEHPFVILCSRLACLVRRVWLVLAQPFSMLLGRRTSTAYKSQLNASQARTQRVSRPHRSSYIFTSSVANPHLSSCAYPSFLPSSSSPPSFRPRPPPADTTTPTITLVVMAVTLRPATLAT